MGQGFATAGLHLAPAWLSGHNACASHNVECAKACLNTAGFGGIYPKIQEARIRKTKMFFTDRSNFLRQLHKDIEKFATSALDEKLVPVFRLNLTSDINWQAYNIMQVHTAFQFYNYTRVPSRRVTVPNYHLTFSWSGDNEVACRQAIADGLNIAAPFIKRPATFLGLPTLDGDEDDLRFLDPPGHVVGLKLKGRLRGMKTAKFIGDNHAHLCA